MSGITLDRIAASPALEPFDRPIAVDARGRAFIPHPFDARASMMRLPIGVGVTVHWAALASGTALLALFAGQAEDHPDEAIAIALTRAELQQLILDLVSIDQQMGAM